MATNNNTKTNTSTSKTTVSTTSTKAPSTGYLINLLSYIAVCVGGVALFLAFILSKFDISAGFISAMQKIANAVAWAVVSFLSFRYIKRRHKAWMWVVWAVALVMVIIGIILA